MQSGTDTTCRHALYGIQASTTRHNTTDHKKARFTASPRRLANWLQPAGIRLLTRELTGI